METSCSPFVEETSFTRTEDEDEAEENEEEDKEESADRKQRLAAWAPSFYCRMGKEVYSYAGHEIVIEEGLDSYAGMIWPGALALCRYLETHRDQLNLMDKPILEIGAGTGLVSVVATLLGGWVTATDLPEVLSNTRANLCRNTRGLCRHTPQVAPLPWGYNLESTYPSTVYKYHYVLAADVVYHHDFLDELLVTMKHFCKPGTTLIWANKVRFESDLVFTENFKKAFHTSLLVEEGEMKIFMATSREGDDEVDRGLKIQDLLGEEDGKTVEEESNKDNGEGKPSCACKEVRGDTLDNYNEEEEDNKFESDVEEEEIVTSKNVEHNEIVASNDNISEQECSDQTDVKQKWVPNIICHVNKDIYHYVGKDIVIYESIDSFGAMMWPAALALCSFLDNNRDTVDLRGKRVLELGAGTGLVAIVASLLGASVTATDLPEILGNLQANLMRNTRGLCRHTPQVAPLPWGYDLESTYPSSVYKYDYVLAADVVYHHDFLDELLVTMKHFCKPGTTLIWANKVRFESDLVFTENFKKAFHTSLLIEEGEMKIFMATSREGDEGDRTRLGRPTGCRIKA
ncbi:uncharacterized protein LOC129369492 isoform X2 [Poeciliopsis prolifica]|uniref:uncharacterized protein LOC129369492 isoform X2 n=1 Tax=Poeciliopsis prolifica TaxID=188132 RepID=UPI0024139495|nr:uncharacterized protein LOC129369492 isoform X2 [Poeciliopsis prolifica]